MKPLLLIGALLWLALGAAAQDPDPLVETIVPDALSPAWAEIFDGLQQTRRIRSDFTERRTFGFRAQPVVLHGVLRLDRDHGLSLHYLDPDEHTVIVDDEGVLLRDPRGRTRKAPQQAAASTRPLLRAIRFDLAALAPDYLVRGKITGADWILWLEPRQQKQGTIEMRGQFDRVHTITLQPSARRQVEVAFSHVQTDVEFSAEERSQYFR